MPTNADSGHGINVSNFRSLILSCTYFGAAYNPVLATIKLVAMNALASAAEAALNDLRIAVGVYTTQVAQRATAFEPLNALITRVVNAFEVSGASPALIEAVRSLGKQVKGRRVNSAPTAEPSAKNIAAVQGSYVARANALAELIALLVTNAAIYNPGEAALKTDALTTLLLALQSENSDVENAIKALEMARMARNEVLYHPETGVVAVALLAKKYVRSVFGARSPEALQVGAIVFTWPSKS
jgi:hypothetical protein